MSHLYPFQHPGFNNLENTAVERVSLSEEIESDVRVLLRILRTNKHAEAFLVVSGGKLRVRTHGKPCQRVGRYAVQRGTTWEELGEVVRGDVDCAIRQAFEGRLER